MVIDRSLAAAAGLMVGDPIDVAVRDARSTLAIVGIAVGTAHGPYPLDTTTMFVTPETLTEFTGPHYWVTGVRLDDREATGRFITSIRSSSLGATTWQDVRSVMSDDTMFTVVLMGAFSVFALLAAGLIITNTVTGQMQSQVRDVGLLKTIGFTPGQVTLLFVGQVLVIVVRASAIGANAGLLASPLFLGDIDAMLPSDARVSFGPAWIAAVVVSVTALALVATLYPAWQAGHGSTVRAITGTGANAGSGRSRLSAAAARFGLPRVVCFGLKDVFSRRARAWLTIAAVAVASAAVVATLTIESTVAAMIDDPTLVGLDPVALEVERNEGPSPITDDELIALVEARDEVEAYVTKRWMAAEIDGERYVSWAIGGQPDAIPFRILEGRMFQEVGSLAVGGERPGLGRGEAIIGLGLARKLGISVGDTRVVGLTTGMISSGGPAEMMTFVGIYPGNEIMFSYRDLRAVMPSVNVLDAGMVSLLLRPGTDPDRFGAELIAGSAGRLTVTNIVSDTQENLTEARRIFRPVMAGLSAFLLLLVVVNLLATLLLSVRERMREIGVMKAIGFTPRQVAVSVMSGAMLLAVAGAIVGAPAGWLFMRTFLELPLRRSGIPGDIVQMPSLGWLAVLVGFAALVAALGSAIPARRAAGIGVSDALRYE